MRRFEHYELLTGEDGKPVELGRGAMGITYKAFDVDLRCPVALKVISEKYVGDESARSRFLREAQVAAKVRHTNVASVFHLGRTGENYFYAMEFPGAFAGTPEFASPEQFAGVGVDIRSDLYSLGVTLWEMLVGRVPFRGTAAEMMYRHLHAQIPLEQLEGLPQPVVVLLEMLLEKDPERRFQTPAELLNAILTITGAIDARRRITRRILQKTPSTA